RLHIQPIETGVVGPERSEEVKSLHPRPFERFVEVRIPVIPKLDNIQERLNNRLILIIPAWSSDPHKRFSIFQDNARRQRVSGAGTRTDLRGTFRIKPELLATDTHPDAGIA